MPFIILIRGAGDIASGVALRLHLSGMRVVMTELPQPLSVRRLVSFAEAIYAGETTVEGVTAKRVQDPTDALKILRILSQGQIPVLVDPTGEAIAAIHPGVVVDGRMLKQKVELVRTQVQLLVGLGPGFIPGENCHAVVETNRGHQLGRVYWKNPAQDDTGIPEAVAERAAERVLRAPADGELKALAEIGAILEGGQPAAEVNGQQVTARFHGVLRGLIHPGIQVKAGMKIGDLDPRADPRLCSLVSDKSLAVGGAVLEAILSRPNLRAHLWT
jgi:xanthine dehydrogenase accessory factor